MRPVRSPPVRLSNWRRFTPGRCLNRPRDCPPGVWFLARSWPAAGRVMATPRIGVAYAGLFWSRRKLRFVLTRSMLQPEPPIRPLLTAEGPKERS